MTKEYQKGLAAALKLAPVVPVMVIENVEDAVPLARALVKGGLPVLEITLRTAKAMDCIRAIIAEGHVRLAETLAERIAAACFEDTRVKTVRVRVEKLEALTAAESVGIEIERTR